MEKSLVFNLRVKGTSELVKEISRVDLELDSTSKALAQIKKDLSTFETGSDAAKEALIQQGKSVESLTADYEQYKAKQLELRRESKLLNQEVRDLGKEFDEQKNKVPKNSLIGLRNEYKKLRGELDKTDEALLSTAENQQKLARANSLKQRIDEYGESVRDFRSQVGGYFQAIQRFFSQSSGGGLGFLAGGTGNLIGTALGALTSGFTGLPPAIGGATSALGAHGAAIGAVIGLVGTQVTQIKNITKEYEELRFQVNGITGDTGEQLRVTTEVVKTLADVYNVEFDKILNIVNAVRKEFKVTTEEASDFIRAGFGAGLDINGDFLDNVREYSAQVRAAGGDQQDLFDILQLSVQEGIYSDKGIDTVKEFGLRVREQTATGRAALRDAFGEKFAKEIFDGIDDGSLTTIEALKDVAGEINNLQIPTSDLQKLIADLFGGAGEDAGLRYIRLLENLGEATEDVTEKTDAWAARQNQIFENTLRLNAAQNDISIQLAGLGTSFEGTGLLIRSVWNEAISNIIRGFRLYKAEAEIIFEDVTNIFKGNFEFFTKSRNDVIFEANRRVREADAETLKAKTEEENQLQRTAEAYEEYASRLKNVTSLNEDQQKKLQALVRTRDEVLQRIENDDNDINVSQNLLGSLEQLDADIAQFLKGADVVRKTGAERLAEQKKAAEAAKRIREQEIKERENLLNKIDSLEEKTFNTTLSANEKRRQTILNQYADIFEDVIDTFGDGSDEYKRVVENFHKDLQKVEEDATKDRLKEEEKYNEERAKIAEEIATLQREITKQQLNESILDIRTFTFELENLQREADKKIASLVGTPEEIQKQTELVKQQLALSVEELTNERAKLLIQQTNEFRDAETNFQEQESILGIIGEINNLNLDNTGYAEARKALEDQITLIQKEASLQRLNNLIESGNAETDAILERAKLEVEINDLKNKDLIDANAEATQKELKEEEDKLKAKEKFINQYQKNVENAGESIGEAFGTFFTDFATDSDKAIGELGKSFQKVILDLIIDQLTLMAVTAIAQPDSVASFGATGSLRIAILTGLVKAASSGLKALVPALLSEEGNVLGNNNILNNIKYVAKDNIQSTYTQNLKRGAIFKGRTHKQGGEHFTVNGKLNEAEEKESIINATNTQKFAPLLSAINEYDNNGVQFAYGSEKYKPLLDGMIKGYFNAGGITGSNTAGLISTDAPQLVQPRSIQNVVVVDTKPLEDTLKSHLEESTEVVTSSVNSVKDAVSTGVSDGLDERITRLERLQYLNFISIL